VACRTRKPGHSLDILRTIRPTSAMQGAYARYTHASTARGRRRPTPRSSARRAPFVGLLRARAQPVRRRLLRRGAGPRRRHGPIGLPPATWVGIGIDTRRSGREVRCLGSAPQAPAVSNLPAPRAGRARRLHLERRRRRARPHRPRWFRKDLRPVTLTGGGLRAGFEELVDRSIITQARSSASRVQRRGPGQR
jgi:hypothetical protein